MKKKHPTKKHTTKKHFTEKYFTKAFMKTHIIPISAIGILVGATAITLGVTSCKSNPPSPIPSDAKVITENIDNKYIVQSDEIIWTSNIDKINSHNKLLDLASYVFDGGISTNNFVIDGEIDFGILVGFNEDVNLFGYPQSLISLGTKDSPLTTNVYGIIIGSASQPTKGENFYSGKMSIDNSVNVFINSWDRTSGVCFLGIRDANITIDGVFTIGSKSNSRSSSGVEFGNVSSSSIYIDGIFNINGGMSHGVYFVHGAGATDINIDGIFILNSTEEDTGVYFAEAISACIININGIFTIRSNGPSAYGANGVLFNGVIDNEINIGGVFTITSNMTTAYGIRFKGDVNSIEYGEISANGVFALDAKSHSCFGVFIQSEVTQSIWNPYSNTQFFSFGTNSGNWQSKFPGASYQWNGIQISGVGTSQDIELITKPVVAYDNPDFSINVIQTTLQQPGNDYNQNIFNKRYKNGLDNYITNHSTCPKNVIDWLKDIINQIPII